MKNSTALKKHDVSTLTVFFMIFCMVCAGSYGIEDMIPSAGPGLTLVLLMVLPFFWSIPQGLIAAELGSAIPEEGGYYKWIQRALGEFWGFQACWWRTVSIYVDSTLYVILAVGYLDTLLPLSGVQAFALKTALIVIITVINILGLSDIGRLATALSVFVIASFGILIVVGFSHVQYNPFIPFTPYGQTVPQSIGLGIVICMWMYAGYESMSTMAGEAKNPLKISKATILSVPAIMLFYVLTTAASLCAVGTWFDWGVEGGISFGSIGDMLHMHWLSVLFVITALAANVSMYNTYLASGSRGFYSLAEDNLAPSFFGGVGKKFRTPYVAIITMAVINILLCNVGFDTLVVIDVFLLMFAYILIYISAIVLRKKEPDLERPFKIRLGFKGIVVICVCPIILCVVALFTNGLDYFIGGCIAIISGPVAYLFAKKRYGGLDGSRKLSPKDKRISLIMTGVILIALVIALFIWFM